MLLAQIHPLAEQIVTKSDLCVTFGYQAIPPENGQTQPE
jgi:hypothetical protein